MSALLNVLAIDDDINFLLSLQMALRSHYNILIARNLKEALEAYSSHKIDAILLDLDLGNTDGADLLVKLNENPGRAPVIVVSGTMDLRKARELLNLQVFGFIEKPASLAELLQCLDSATRKGTQSDVLRDTDFSLDLHKRVVNYQGTELAMTRTQTELIALFLKKKGATLSRDELIKCIWGDQHISRNVLDTHLFNIKQKLPPFKQGLRLIHGRGYCYEN